MNKFATWIQQGHSQFSSTWERLTDPLVVIPDTQRRLIMKTQASVLLAGSLIFLLQLIVRLLELLPASSFALIGLGIGILFNLLEYFLARFNALEPIPGLVCASLIVFSLTAFAPNPEFEILFYTVLIVLYSTIHSTRSQAIFIFALNIVGMLVLPLVNPSITRENIAAALTFYVIGSLIIFTYVEHYRADLQKQETERIQREEDRLRIALQDEQKKVVERFVRAFSHYFRNQLSVIETNRYVIPRLASDPEQLQQRIDKIGDSVKQLRDQLDNLRIIIGVDATNARPCSVNPLIEVLGEQYRGAAQERNLDLNVQIGADRLMVLVSEEHLKSAIVQLLLNAIAHTKPGGAITLSARSNADQLEIVVSDTGSGIQPQRQGEIFDFFFKGDTAMSIDRGGIGIGLSIVKMVAEVYGGDVRVISEVGQGSTFTIRFPLWHGDPPTPSDSHRVSSGIRTNGSVFVVPVRPSASSNKTPTPTPADAKPAT